MLTRVGQKCRVLVPCDLNNGISRAFPVLDQFAESHLAKGRFDAVNCPKTAAAPGHFTTRTFSRNAI